MKITWDTVTIPGNQQYRAFDYTLSGDFSSASYFIAAGVLFPGTIRLKGLNMQDAQGDKQLVDIILEMGGNITFDGADMIITGGKQLQGIRIDASKFPICCRRSPYWVQLHRVKQTSSMLHKRA